MNPQTNQPASVSPFVKNASIILTVLSAPAIWTLLFGVYNEPYIYYNHYYQESFPLLISIAPTLVLGLWGFSIYKLARMFNDTKRLFLTIIGIIILLATFIFIINYPPLVKKTSDIIGWWVLDVPSIFFRCIFRPLFFLALGILFLLTGIKKPQISIVSGVIYLLLFIIQIVILFVWRSPALSIFIIFLLFTAAIFWSVFIAQASKISNVATTADSKVPALPKETIPTVSPLESRLNGLSNIELQSIVTRGAENPNDIIAMKAKTILDSRTAVEMLSTKTEDELVAIIFDDTAYTKDVRNQASSILYRIDSFAMQQHILSLPKEKIQHLSNPYSQERLDGVANMVNKMRREGLL